jgi:hypothetical protein
LEELCGVHLQCVPGIDGYSKVLQHTDTYTSMSMRLHPRNCVLDEHHCENTKHHRSVCSYEKMIWSLEFKGHLVKPLNFLTLSNVILLMVTSSQTIYVCNIWTFTNVRNFNPVKQWGSLLGGGGGQSMFHMLIYSFTYLNAVPFLIYIKKEKIFYHAQIWYKLFYFPLHIL